MPQPDKISLYETVYIVRPTLDEDGLDNVIKVVEEFMTKEGCAIKMTDKKGRKRLAYEVKKMRDGYYVSTIFEAKPDAIAAIKRMMTISEEIIRSIIVSVPPVAAEITS
jgi:small subunit ribosomal protein S6